MRLFKDGCRTGWVSQEWGGWFYNGGGEIFKVSLYSWQRDAKPVLYEDPPILSPPPPHTSLSLQTPTPTVLSIVLFLWQNGWSHHIWCAILLNDNMDLHMFSLGTLAPEGSWYVLYAKGVKLTEIWNIFFTGTLIWYHTHKHTQHTQRPVDWHAHIIYIYTTCYVLTAATSITLNDYFPQCLFFSKIIQL